MSLFSIIFFSFNLLVLVWSFLNNRRYLKKFNKIREETPEDFENYIEIYTDAELRCRASNSVFTLLSLYILVNVIIYVIFYVIF